MTLNIGVLALQGAFIEHQRMVARLGHHSQAVRTATQLDDIDALIIPGGESTAMARIAQPTGMMAAVRKRVESGMPVLGTCAGLVLLAESLDDERPFAGLARIGVLPIRATRNGYGRQLQSTHRQVDYLNSARERRTDGSPPPSVEVAFIRAPRIVDMDVDVEVLAVAGQEVVAVQAGHVLAATYHPELSDDSTLHRALISRAVI